MNPIIHRSILFFIFLNLLAFASAQVPAISSSKSPSKIQQLIDQNWEFLSYRLADIKAYPLTERDPEVSAKKAGAIAAKGFEFEGQGVKTIIFVFQTYEKLKAAQQKIGQNPPLAARKHLVRTANDMLLWIYTDRTDDDVEWVIGSLSDAFALKE